MRNDACSLLLLETKIMILRETQNQNDADDANDAESGIWYRGILKTASQASSASLSSHKSSAGVWGYTPEMCMWMTTCYASKTRLPPQKNDSTQPRCPYKFVYPQSESTVIHPKILTRKSESVLIHSVQINGNPLFIKKSTKIFLNSTQGYRKS